MRVTGKETNMPKITPVLIISGCNPYSLAKTNGTIPCERAACTMAARSRTPLIPTATEVVDITIGPQMNLIAIAIVALFLPHTIIRG